MMSHRLISLLLLITIAMMPLDRKQATNISTTPVPTLEFQLSEQFTLPIEGEVRLLEWNVTNQYLRMVVQDSVLVKEDGVDTFLQPQNHDFGRVLDAQWLDEEQIGFADRDSDETHIWRWNIHDRHAERIASLPMRLEIADIQWETMLAAGRKDEQWMVWDFGALPPTIIVDYSTFYISAAYPVDVVWSPSAPEMLWQLVPIRNLAGNLSLTNLEENDRYARSLNLGYGEPECTSINWSFDGSQIACGQEDGSVYLMSSQSPPPVPPRFLEGLGNMVLDVVFSQDGSLIAAVSLQSVAVWDLPQGELLSLIEVSRGNVVALSSNNRKLAVGTHDAAIQIFEQQ